MVSFVVPSMRARRDDLLACLAGLRREAAGTSSEALVVVEDADAAAGLASEGAAGLIVRPVIQAGGAARRRNAAFRVLRGDVVALIDDDAVPEPGYVAALLARFADGKPRVVQGAVWPAFDVEPPDSVRPVLFSVGGFNCLGEERRRDVFISANCAFSRAVLEQVGPMREDLGPGSGGAAWGDDTDWQARATAAGFPTELDLSIAVRHRIQRERLTEDYVFSRAEKVGRTRARLEWRDRRPGAAFILRMRVLTLWARVRGGATPGRLLARRLAGYTDEAAKIRGERG